MSALQNASKLEDNAQSLRQSLPIIDQLQSTFFPLFLLPFELRQKIYSCIVHENPTALDLCYNSWLDQGCRCARSISIVNRQLYEEVRPLVYKYGKFSLYYPHKFVDFLKDIGEANIKHLGSLAVSWGWNPYELQEMLHRLRPCTNLHTLLLNARDPAYGTDPGCGTSAHALAYMPTASRAKTYDFTLRNCDHPLTKFEHIEHLTVLGVPDTQTEEAIFNLVGQMERRAYESGNVLRKTHSRFVCIFRIASAGAP